MVNRTSGISPALFINGILSTNITLIALIERNIYIMGLVIIVYICFGITGLTEISRSKNKN